MSIALRFGDRCFLAFPGETVLETLERGGERLPSSCRSGVCQSCLVQATVGTPPANSQVGLKDPQKQRGYFLACLCRPQSDLEFVSADDVAFRGEVRIESVTALAPDVVRVRFLKPPNFVFRAGQFVTLSRADGLARSYSIASVPEKSDATFDIHVRRVPQGQMSSWFHEEARPGTTLWLRGPKGDCFYTGETDQPLVLVGTGTGIAPLAALMEDALLRGHRGPIRLYQGALSADRLYYVDELVRLAEAHSNVRYRRCVLAGERSESVYVGDLAALVCAELGEARSHRVFLCGDPELVTRMRKSLFLGGVSLKNIFADPFV